MKNIYFLLLFALYAQIITAQTEFSFVKIQPESIADTISYNQLGPTDGWGGIVNAPVQGQVVYAPEDINGNRLLCDTPMVDFTNKIVLIDRGECFFSSKAFQAQELGAIAVIIRNYENNVVNMAQASNDTNVIIIPTIMIPYDMGIDMEEALLNEDTVVVGFFPELILPNNPCVENDRSALVAFYQAMDGDNWINKTNWLTDAPLRDWFGVTTNAQGCVSGLEVNWPNENNNIGSGNGLNGTLPDELWTLSDLETLVIAEGSSEGVIRGRIDDKLLNLTKLKRLSILGGPNRFIEGFIPSNINQLENLESISLTNNRLSGSLPVSIGQLEKLTHLVLSNTKLSGIIPDEIGNLKKLRSLVFSSNSFTGTIPASITQLSDLGYWCFSHNQFTGEIPANISSLKNLWVFDLSHNNLSGTIPVGLSMLPKLIFLHLEKNKITGEIPFELFNLKELESLRLSHNKLTGIIPPELGLLSKLSYLSLNNNQLVGPIPASLGELEEINVINLASNNLSGCFPESFKKLCYLTKFETGNFSCQSNGNEFEGCQYDFRNNPELSWGGDFSRFCSGEVQPCSNTQNCEERDRAVLIEFYQAMDGANWIKNDNWLSNAPLNEWYGVSTNEQGCVSGLDLDGSLVTSWNGNNVISGSGNGLNGTLPDELWNLTELEYLAIFDGPNVKIRGEINENILNLTKLRVLYIVSSGLIKGYLPVNFGKLKNLESIKLGGNALSGELPSSIGELTNLKHLVLANNQFIGSIPSSLGNLKELETLSMHLNDFTGSLPTTIGNLSNLELISLSYNELSGSIPPELGNLTKLEYLDLAYNQISGLLPAELGALSNLVDLKLNNNNLSGCFPSSFSNICDLTNTNLRDCSYYNNNLEGCQYDFKDNPELSWGGDFSRFCSGEVQPCENTLNCEERDRAVLIKFYQAMDGDNWINKTNWLTDAPLNEWYGVTTNVQGCVSVLELDGSIESNSIVNGNGLNGTIPDKLWTLTDLEELAISDGRSDGIIRGRIDDKLLNLTKLKKLLITGGTNRLIEGFIPENINQLEHLEEIFLANNRLTGPIPTSIGELENLSHISLYNNRLSGNLPPEIAHLKNLRRLNIYGNRFTGNIPPEYGQIEKLGHLGLGYNDLTGEIPVELSNLKELWSLGLGHNKLTGIIPPQLGLLSQLSYLFLNNNQLYGPIPASLGELEQVKIMNLASNNLSGCFPESFKNLCYLTTDEPEYFSCQSNEGELEGCQYDFRNNPRLPNEGDFAAFCSSNQGNCTDVNMNNNSFIGNWTNTNPNTQNIPYFFISEACSKLANHSFGICHPSNCDWEYAFTDINNQSDSMVAFFWNHGFALSYDTLRLLDKNFIERTIFTQYVDNSGRQDRTSIEIFYRSSCDDGIQNGDEIGIDKGGIHCNPETTIPCGLLNDILSNDLQLSRKSSVHHYNMKVLPSYPNPFSLGTTIPIIAPKPSLIQLRVFSPKGQLLYQKKYDLEKGRNELQLDDVVFPVSGLYFYQINNEQEIFSGALNKY